MLVSLKPLWVVTLTSPLRLSSRSIGLSIRRCGRISSTRRVACGHLAIRLITVWRLAQKSKGGLQESILLKDLPIYQLLPHPFPAVWSKARIELATQ
jgi:hypothetical protein